MLLSERETRGLCEQVLNRVKVDDATVTARSEAGGNQRFASGSFTTNGQMENVEVTLTVWKEGRRGSGCTTEITKDALDSIARNAERIARVSPLDQEYVPTLGPQKYRPVDAFAASASKPSFSRRAKSVHRILQLGEEAGVVLAGLLRTSASARGTLTLQGNFDYERSSSGSLGLTARLPDGSSSGYFLRSSVDPERLDAERIARAAIQRARDGRNAQVISPGHYPVILEAQAVYDVLSFFPAAFDARTADEGRSAMAVPGGQTRLGQQVFDPRINFYSNPWHPEVPGSQSTLEGLPAERLSLVRGGIVENLASSRYWAKEKGRTPTPGPVNYILESTSAPQSLEEMISTSDRALLVTRLWYIRMVDPRSLVVTGLTRDGVWLVENGKIKHPVRNFRFNQSLMKMMADGNVDEIGKPERVGPGPAAFYPALKLRRFHFTSASDAV